MAYKVNLLLTDHGRMDDSVNNVVPVREGRFVGQCVPVSGLFHGFGIWIGRHLIAMRSIMGAVIEANLLPFLLASLLCPFALLSPCHCSLDRVV